jgi:hypothetical protein
MWGSISKKPSLASSSRMPAPQFVEDEWVERPENPRKISLWENCEKEKITRDSYNIMGNYVLVTEE